jgi:hypothetical protein
MLLMAIDFKVKSRVFCKIKSVVIFPNLMPIPFRLIHMYTMVIVTMFVCGEFQFFTHLGHTGNIDLILDNEYYGYTS